MYNENTMKILFRFSQIPTTVYTPEWKKLKEFTCIHEEPEKFEAERLKEAKEGLTGKNFLFLPYDALVPIGLCAAAEEKRSTISWDLFPMGEQILLSAEILYGEIRSGNVQGVSWTIFLR